jgi:hypothetical protein
MAGELGPDESSRTGPPAFRGLSNCFLTNSSLSLSTIFHFMPLPGSSVRRATFSKHLLSDKLWRMEFYVC